MLTRPRDICFIAFRLLQVDDTKRSDRIAGTRISDHQNQLQLPSDHGVLRFAATVVAVTTTVVTATTTVGADHRGPSPGRYAA